MGPPGRQLGPNGSKGQGKGLRGDRAATAATKVRAPVGLAVAALSAGGTGTARVARQSGI